MAKALEGKERERMLEEFAQVDAINQLEGFEPDEFMQQLRQAILDGVATSAQLRDEMGAFVREHGTLEGFLESRPWWRKRPAA